MNKSTGLQLVVYSLLLAGLGYVVHHLAPTLAQPTLIAGLAGGVLCLVWGVRAVLGKTAKALPILTLIPISYVMLTQTVMTWGGGSQEVPGRQTAAAVTTVLLAVSIAMLMRIAYAGVVFDGLQTSPTKDGGAQIPNDRETNRAVQCRQARLRSQGSAVLRPTVQPRGLQSGSA